MVQESFTLWQVIYEVTWSKALYSTGVMVSTWPTLQALSYSTLEDGETGQSAMGGDWAGHAETLMRLAANNRSLLFFWMVFHF